MNTESISFQDAHYNSGHIRSILKEGFVLDCVILLPSHQAVEARRDYYAQNGAPQSFGALILTPDAYLDFLWDAFGDFRRIADSMHCLAALHEILRAHGEEDEKRRQGIASFLLELIEGGYALETSEGTFQDILDEGVSTRYLLGLLEGYRQLLESKGLIDPFHAWLLLAEQNVICCPTEVDASAVELAAAQREFFKSQKYVTLLEASTYMPAASCLEVVALLPAGEYAEAALLKDALLDVASYGPAAVATQHPLKLFEEAGQGLLRHGLSSWAWGSASFSETAFGKAFLAAWGLLSSDQFDLTLALDYLLNPFAGLDIESAHMADVLFRSDRGLKKERALTEIRKLSRPFEYFEDLVSCSDAFVLLDYFEDLSCQIWLEDNASAQLQVTAIETLRAYMGAIFSFGMDMGACIDALSEAKVSVSLSLGEAPYDVLFASAADAVSLALGSMGCLVACDLSDGIFLPQRHGESAKSFLEHRGLLDSDYVLRRRKDVFNLLQRVPCRAFFVERLQRDEEGSSLYPASVAEEVFQLYEGSSEHALCSKTWRRGEDLLHENASCEAWERVDLGFYPGGVAADSEWTCSVKNLSVLPKRMPVSQLESYLACSYAWFVKSCLRTEELDEGFGPKEKGIFAHEVLRRFYERLQEEGLAKVTGNNFSEASDIMEEVLEECVTEQEFMEPGSGRLLAVREMEYKQLEELISSLREYLPWEKALLPDFAPAYLEYQIEPKHAVDYAGMKVFGRVDRIDLDAYGKAVVIDYKSSISVPRDYQGPDESSEGLGAAKIQALVYAQIIRRLLGLDVVGVLYVSYGREKKVAGVMDATLAASGAIAEKNASIRVLNSCSFAEYLDAVEARVEEALKSMKDAPVEPGLASTKACRSCFVSACPLKGGSCGC